MKLQGRNAALSGPTATQMAESSSMPPPPHHHHTQSMFLIHQRYCKAAETNPVFVSVCITLAHVCCGVIPMFLTVKAYTTHPASSRSNPYGKILNPPLPPPPSLPPG